MNTSPQHEHQHPMIWKSSVASPTEISTLLMMKNERMRKLMPERVVSTLTGGLLQCFYDGVGGNAQFRSPTGLPEYLCR